MLSHAKHVLLVISAAATKEPEILRLARNDKTRLLLQRFDGSTINLQHKFAARIDIAAVHAICIERQCNLAALIDGDQTTSPAELFHAVQRSLCSFLQFHPAALPQR